MAKKGARDFAKELFTTKRKGVKAHTPAHEIYLNAIEENVVTFCVGRAGTGKTYMAVGKAVEALMAGEVERIVITRPVVESGESLGFLPGDVGEKVAPYMAPMLEALQDFLTPAELKMALSKVPEEGLERPKTGPDRGGKGGVTPGCIIIAPLAFMRGRTFNNAFAILDEAQNTTPKQLLMFLTRLGRKSRAVVTGDLSQTDLPAACGNGLGDAVVKLWGMNRVGMAQLGAADQMRNDIINEICTRLSGDKDLTGITIDELGRVARGELAVVPVVSEEELEEEDEAVIDEARAGFDVGEVDEDEDDSYNPYSGRGW